MEIYTFIYIENGIVEDIQSFDKKFKFGKWFTEKYGVIENIKDILEELDENEYYCDGCGCEYHFMCNNLMKD